MSANEPTDEMVSVCLQTFRREIDIHMDLKHPSSSPGHDAMRIALFAMLKVTPPAPDALRWRWLRFLTGAARSGDGECVFVFPKEITKPQPTNLMRGSVAGHLDARVDAMIASATKERTE